MFHRPSSESHLVAKRIAALDVSDTLAAERLPLFAILATINEQIAAADRRIIEDWHTTSAPGTCRGAPLQRSLEGR